MAKKKPSKPSAIAALWTTLINLWTTLINLARTSHVWHAGVVFTAHILLGMWCWVLIWLSERAFHGFSGPSPGTEAL
jgi:hypothetical protein